MPGNIKNQHTVTRAYLRRWADSTGAVHIFDLKTGRQRRENISNVSVHRYFYSPPDGKQEFEAALGRLECFWMEAQLTVLKAADHARRMGLQGPKIVHKEDKELLADALVQQLLRTPRARETFLHLEEDAARDAHLEFMTQPAATGLSVQLYRGIWLVGVIGSKLAPLSLYTSDHPVCVVPMNASVGGKGNRLKGFMYPLSPSHLLLIYARGATNFNKEWDGRVLPLDANTIGQSNALQASSAERTVISSTRDLDLARRWRRAHRTPAR